MEKSADGKVRNARPRIVFIGKARGQRKKRKSVLGSFCFFSRVVS